MIEVTTPNSDRLLGTPAGQQAGNAPRAVIGGTAAHLGMGDALAIGLVIEKQIEHAAVTVILPDLGRWIAPAKIGVAKPGDHRVGIHAFEARRIGRQLV